MSNGVIVQGFAIRAVFVCAIVLGSLGCRVTSVNPVGTTATGIAVPDLWLGKWTVDLVAGSDPGTVVTVDIKRGDGGFLLATVVSEAETSVVSASLSAVGEAVIVSVRGADVAWIPVRVDVDANGGAMGIRPLAPTLVRAHVEANVVAGRMSVFDRDDVNVTLTCTSEQSHAYLAEHPESFGPVLIGLRKMAS